MYNTRFSKKTETRTTVLYNNDRKSSKIAEKGERNTKKFKGGSKVVTKQISLKKTEKCKIVNVSEKHLNLNESKIGPTVESKIGQMPETKIGPTLHKSDNVTMVTPHTVQLDKPACSANSASPSPRSSQRLKRKREELSESPSRKQKFDIDDESKTVLIKKKLEIGNLKYHQGDGWNSREKKTTDSENSQHIGKRKMADSENSQHIGKGKMTETENHQVNSSLSERRKGLKSKLVSSENQSLDARNVSGQSIESLSCDSIGRNKLCQSSSTTENLKNLDANLATIDGNDDEKTCTLEVNIDHTYQRNENPEKIKHGGYIYGIDYIIVEGDKNQSKEQSVDESFSGHGEDQMKEKNALDKNEVVNDSHMEVAVDNDSRHSGNEDNSYCDVSIKSAEDVGQSSGSNSNRSLLSIESDVLSSIESDILSKIMNFEIQPRQVINSDRKAVNSLVEKDQPRQVLYTDRKAVNSLVEKGHKVTFLTPGDDLKMRTYSNKSDVDESSVRISSISSSAVPGGSHITLDGITNNVYTSSMVAMEIKDDQEFGPVSAVIKSLCMSPDTLSEMVKRTGVTVIHKDNKQTVIQGSWKAVKRAKSWLQIIQEEERRTNILDIVCLDKTKPSSPTESTRINNKQSQMSESIISKSKNLDVINLDKRKHCSSSEMQKLHYEQSQNFDIIHIDKRKPCIPLEMIPYTQSEMSENNLSNLVKCKKIDITENTETVSVGEVSDLTFTSQSVKKLSELNETVDDKSIGKSLNADESEIVKSEMSGSDEAVERSTKNATCDTSTKHFPSAKNQYINVEAPLKCDLCSRTFWTEALLQGHREQKHTPNVCQLCGKEFACKRYLQMHIKRHTDNRRFECTICGWKFMERYKLKLHLESHKSVSERVLPYKCEVCWKQFYNKAGWSDHMNTHTGNRPFKCEQCDASFAHRIGLRHHLVVHSKTKPYICLHCNKGFHFKSKLDAHLIVHTGVSNYSCELCGKVFTVSSSLKRHMESCQGNKVEALVYVNEDQLSQSTVDMINATVADPEAVYMCGICGSIFNTLELASLHTATHEAQQNGSSLEQTLVDTAAYQEIVTADDVSLENQNSHDYIPKMEVLPSS